MMDILFHYLLILYAAMDDSWLPTSFVRLIFIFYVELNLIIVNLKQRGFTKGFTGFLKVETS